MKISRFADVLPFAMAAFLAVAFFAESSQAADPMRVEVQLVWATNDPRSPDPKHKAIDAELARRLSRSPYRWKNYFEVNRLGAQIPNGQTRKSIKMSDHCTLDIKNLGNDWAEIKLYGNGKLVSTHKEQLPLILAGDAKNDTAWLVVIKKADARAVSGTPANTK